MTNKYTGKNIADYELLEIVGDGSQGKIFKARCIVQNNPSVAFNEIVALKVLRYVRSDRIIGARFQQLANALRNLGHRNIVRYRDFFVWQQGDWDDAKCIVTDYLEGETLQGRIQQSGKGLPWTEVKTIFEQCFDALIYAGSMAIVHRDIKPSNIFLCQDGTVKLIDFEIARREETGDSSTADWKGTFDYMAPDFVALNNFHGDGISDIFSLGICLFQSLTGNLPFPPLDQNAMVGYVNRWHEAKPLDPDYGSGVFKVLARARATIDKSIQRQRDQRYHSFEEMRADFQAIQYRIIRHKRKDEYELRTFLGRGGFGEVYKARRLKDNRWVAVKHLFAERQSRRFIQEAGLLRRYPHDHIVEYVDFIELEDSSGMKQFFLVMEFLEGMPEWTLRNRLKERKGGLELRESIDIFIHYLEALEFLHNHKRPIIHRDIKPSNLYAPPGYPEKAKIFDFGIARDITGTQTTGQIPGTLDYMAPELAFMEGARGSPQTDIYSLGLSLYETLTGHSALPRLPTSSVSEGFAAFMARVQRKPEVPFSDEVFRRYPLLTAIVKQAMAWNPEDRFRQAADMLEQLTVFRQQLDTGIAGEDQPEEVTVGEIKTLTIDRPLSLQHPERTLHGVGIEPVPKKIIFSDEREDKKPGRFAFGRAVKWVMAGVLFLVAALGITYLWNPRIADKDSVKKGLLGELHVMTKPSGAVITLDQKIHHQSPAKFIELTPGEHQVLVEMPEYKSKELTLKILQNAAVITNIILEKIKYGNVGISVGLPLALRESVSLPEQGEFKIDESPWKSVKFPHVEPKVEVGKKMFSIKVTGYDAVQPKYMWVEEGKTNTVLFDLSPLSGRLTVVSDQGSDIEIWKNDRLIATCGQTIEDILPGKHRFELRAKGYQTNSFSVIIHPGELVTSKAPVLIPLPGILTVTADLEAEVWKNGVMLGRTGQALVNFPSGSHALEIRRPKYQSMKMVAHVPPGDAVTLQAPILSVLPGSLTVETVEEAEVIENGKVIGKTGKMITNMTAGAHSLVLQRKGYKPAELKVEMLAGEHVKVNGPALLPQPGQLVVSCNPPAEVWKKGEGMFGKDTYLGKTEGVITGLNAGVHEIRIKLNDYNTENVKVTIPPGELVNITNIHLSKTPVIDTIRP